MAVSSAAQAGLTKAEARLELLPKLLKTLYEDRISGRTTDEDAEPEK